MSAHPGTGETAPERPAAPAGASAPPGVPGPGGAGADSPVASLAASVRGVRFTVPSHYEEVAARLTGLDRLGKGAGDGWDLERACRAAWTRIAEPGNRTASALIAQLGPVAALYVASAQTGEMGERYRPRIGKLNVPRDMEIAARAGARLITPADPEWPGGLGDLEAPPVALWVRGNAHLAEVCARSVAIVGARDSTPYGMRIAADLAHELAGRGYGIVSGAAFGIDAAAHQGALAAGRPTVAVLACGIERAYPASHAGLLESIAASGAVVSEIAPGSAPLRSRFLERNRLIATMSQGTVVAESGARSGSHNTARTAAAHHRVVMAFPGPVTSALSTGNHDLIRQRVAELVTGADDVVELLSPMGEGQRSPGAGPTLWSDALGPDERRVAQALTASGKAVVRLAEITGLAPRTVTAILGRLELAALAERTSPAGSLWRAPRRRGVRPRRN